jgi:uncharacterized RmlC-like cupin family protein
VKLVKPAEQDRDTPRGVVGGSEISQATTGATNVFMGRFRVPPGAQSRPHYHANCESALYMLSGSATSSRLGWSWSPATCSTCRRARRTWS